MENPSMSGPSSSLNLHTLASSLPPRTAATDPYNNATSALANAETDLLNDFKAAALSITTLYRSSRQTSKRAYTTGYIAACQDILSMIQQGVSASAPSEIPGESTLIGEGGGVNVGRIMDWVEARLDAVKAREEEEVEEELNARETTATSTAQQQQKGKASVSSAKPLKSQKESTAVTGLATPNSPTTRSTKLPQGQPGTPSPSSSRSPTQPSTRRIRKDSTHSPVSTTSLLPINDTVPITPSDAIPISTGAKRRHAVMMMLDSNGPTPDLAAQPTGTQIGGGRRRLRSNRTHASFGAHISSDAMEIEEDGGRERKRVARR